MICRFGKHNIIEIEKFQEEIIDEICRSDFGNFKCFFPGSPAGRSDGIILLREYDGISYK